MVEEIGLTYTFIRTPDHSRIVVPNEKLASDTIRNASIRGRETYAEVNVQVPLSADLDAVVAGLREETASERDGSVLRQRAQRHGDRDDPRGRSRRGRGGAARAATCASVRTGGCARWASGNDRNAPAVPPSPGDARVGRLRRPPAPPPHARPEAAEPPARCCWSSSSVVPVARARRAPRSRGTAVYGSSCDLSKLTPVGVGENSFVYAADGSVLGAIPAERNRTPVSRGKISPWMAKATVAIEDRRFYQHGGIDPDRHRPRGRRRRARREDRRGRLDDHAGARAQPLPLARADA